MDHARSREGRLEAQREVKEALESLPEQPPEGAAVQVDDPPIELPQLQVPGQEVQVPEPHAVPSQPSNAELLARPASPRASSARAPQVEDGGREEHSSKRARHEENVARRISLVERQLVEVDVGGERFYHLDSIVDVEVVNALETEEVEMKNDGSTAVDEMEPSSHGSVGDPITTKSGRFKVMKNIPGQRLAAKAWYEYLATFLEKRGVEFSKENPCLGRRSGKLFIFAVAFLKPKRPADACNVKPDKNRYCT
eukprot:s1031_g20.t1